MTRASRGVTLIELIVVMVIVSILLAVVAPSISAGLDNLVLESDARRLISAFRAAQANAKSSGQRVFATFEDQRNLTFWGDAGFRRSLVLAKSVRIAVPNHDLTIAFLDSGQVLGPDVIELTNDRRRRVQLLIDHATGLIKLISGQSKDTE